jgi:hypothetical protein
VPFTIQHQKWRSSPLSVSRAGWDTSVVMEPTRVRLAMSGHVLEVDGSMDPPGVRVVMLGAHEQPLETVDDHIWFAECHGRHTFQIRRGVKIAIVGRQPKGA